MDVHNWRSGSDTTPSDTVLSLFLRETFFTAQGHVWLSRDYTSYSSNVALYGLGKEPYLTLNTTDTAIPEPFTLFLTAGALAGLALLRRHPSR